MCDASFSRCLLHADDLLQNANISQALHYFGIHMNCECMPESCAVHCNHRLFVLGYLLRCLFDCVRPCTLLFIRHFFHQAILIYRDFSVPSIMGSIFFDVKVMKSQLIEKSEELMKLWRNVHSSIPTCNAISHIYVFGYFNIWSNENDWNAEKHTTHGIVDGRVHILDLRLGFRSTHDFAACDDIWRERRKCRKCRPNLGNRTI